MVKLIDFSVGYVSWENCTDIEPQPGWYAYLELDVSNEVMGPFDSKERALNALGDYEEY